MLYGLKATPSEDLPKTTQGNTGSNSPARGWAMSSENGVNRVSHDGSGGASRFFYCPKSSKEEREYIPNNKNEVYGDGFGGGAGESGDKKIGERGYGRWPANITMSEEAGAELDKYSEGGSSFFYCPKASRKEREAGLENFSASVVTDGREQPIDNPYQRGEVKRRNTHPTVKPIALMRWCLKMITPPGEGVIILDPFIGSGTTGVAAALEGISLLGIERESEYAQIARARISHWGLMDVARIEGGEIAPPPQVIKSGQLPLF